MLPPNWRAGVGGVQIFARLATPATVFLVMVLAYNLARVTWGLWPIPPSVPAPARVGFSLTPKTARGPNIKAIVDARLFGKADAVRPISAPPRPTAAPETQLKVTLRGIIAAPPPDGWVIIAESGGPDKFFPLGATIAGNARIQEIHPDRVILLRNQQVETLEFPKDKDAKATRTPPPPMMAPPEPEITELEEEPAPEEEAPEEAPPEEDPSQSLNYYREQLLQNPANLAGLLQTLPVYRNGKLEGFRVRPGSKGANLLERFGLKSNDLVTSLNGIPLDNPMKAFEVLRGLRNAATLEVGLSRQGRSENLTLRFSR